MYDYLAPAFDFDRIFTLETVSAAQALVGRVGHLNGPGLAERFQATGHIHGVAPKIISEFPPPDDSRHNWACINPNADTNGGGVLRVKPLDFFPHIQRQFRN